MFCSMEMLELEAARVKAETTTEVVVMVVPACLVVVEVTSWNSVEVEVTPSKAVEVEVTGATIVLKEVTTTPSTSVEKMVEVNSMVWTAMLFISKEGS